MATLKVCDRCGDKSSDLELYRMLPIPSPTITIERTYLDGHASRLEICQRCVNIVMREANTPEPQAAPHD